MNATTAGTNKSAIKMAKELLSSHVNAERIGGGAIEITAGEPVLSRGGEPVWLVLWYRKDEWDAAVADETVSIALDLSANLPTSDKITEAGSLLYYYQETYGDVGRALDLVEPLGGVNGVGTVEAIRNDLTRNEARAILRRYRECHHEFLSAPQLDHLRAVAGDRVRVHGARRASANKPR